MSKVFMNGHRRNIFILVCLFIVTRVLMYMVRPFYFDPITFYMQYLDPVVLKNDLLNGLWHLHSQPPLFNAFLGLLLKFSPEGMAPLVCQGIYSLMTLAVVLGVYEILRFKKTPAWLCFVASCLVMLFPTVIKAETWLFYSCPVIFLIMMSTVCLARFAEKGSAVHFALFILLAAVLVLTRSFFHLILWMIPVAVLGAGYAVYRSRSSVVYAVIVPVIGLCLAGTIYLKNYFQYGMFTASTWQGMNVAAMTGYVGEGELDKMIVSGVVTPLVKIPRFSSPETYFKYYQARPCTGEAVLDSPIKTTRESNWNNEICVRASAEYQKNTMYIVKKHPAKYFMAVVNASYIFFGLAPYLYFWDYGKWGITGGESFIVMARKIAYIYVVPAFLFVMFLAGFAGLAGRLGARVNGGLESGRREWCPVTAYMLFNVVYVFVVANALELGEGCFMRVPVDPLLIIGCALLIQGRTGRVFDRITG